MTASVPHYSTDPSAQRGIAVDLRATLKISSNIERIGDYSANIAKRTIIINGFPPVAALVGVIEMGRFVRKYVQTAFKTEPRPNV